MVRIAECQAHFARALIDRDLPIPDGIHSPTVQRDAERFAVYRNNSAVALTDALRSSFPVVRHLVGEEFFSVVARDYTRFDPPRSPILLSYGGGFPEYLEKAGVTQSLVYVADVARLEWAMIEAYHAPDSEPSFIDMASRPVDSLTDLRLKLHPATRYLEFEMGIAAVWRFHQEGNMSERMDLSDVPEGILITRPFDMVTMMHLSPGTVSFLKAVSSRHSFAQALEVALKTEPTVNRAAMLTLLSHAGAFAGCEESSLG